MGLFTSLSCRDQTIAHSHKQNTHSGTPRTDLDFVCCRKHISPAHLRVLDKIEASATASLKLCPAPPPPPPPSADTALPRPPASPGPATTLLPKTSGVGEGEGGGHAGEKAAGENTKLWLLLLRALLPTGAEEGNDTRRGRL